MHCIRAVCLAVHDQTDDVGTGLHVVDCRFRFDEEEFLLGVADSSDDRTVAQESFLVQELLGTDVGQVKFLHRGQSLVITGLAGGDLGRRPAPAERSAGELHRLLVTDEKRGTVGVREDLETLADLRAFGSQRCDLLVRFLAELGDRLSEVAFDRFDRAGELGETEEDGVCLGGISRDGEGERGARLASHGGLL